MSNNISSLVKPIMSIPSTENRFELINNKSNKSTHNKDNLNYMNIIDGSNLNYLNNQSSNNYKNENDKLNKKWSNNITNLNITNS